MKSSPIRCILFDADGVIVNAEQFSLQYQKRFGVDPAHMNPFFEGIFQQCIVGKADLKKVVAPYLASWNWEGSVEEFLSFWFTAEHTIDEQIAELITSLRSNSIQCYLATNQELYRTAYMRTEMGFEQLFDGVFSSAEIGHRKPDSAYYRHILKQLKTRGIEKEHILYVDDSESHITTARALGLYAHLYTNYIELSRWLKKHMPQ